MLDCAEKGKLFGERIAFRPNVIAQQGLSLMYQNPGRWISADALRGRLPADVGYFKGVPMGGDLTRAPEGKAPSFLVAALKDPLSGNHDRPTRPHRRLSRCDCHAGPPSL